MVPTRPELEQLRARIAALDGSGAEVAAGAMPLGLDAVDRLLPWGGLPLGCLHEVAAGRPGDDGDHGGALAFAAVLLAALGRRSGRPLLWLATGDEPYGPGLAALGLPPERLVVVRAWKPAQALWAVEEGLRCRALGGVLAELWRLDLTAARRLQVTARNSGVTALVLNRGAAIGAAMTRWRVTPRPSQAPAGQGVGPWRWRLDLMRCRGRAVGDHGLVAGWDVEWNNETCGLCLVAAAGDRAAVPESPRPRRHAAG